ncbi:MAG: sugar phosphate isomerase/epimerase [Kofleriaceae bacterium]|nr:sugar phosphate isomerase/epimerase [Kofleriaceae bacterium]
MPCTRREWLRTVVATALMGCGSDRGRFGDFTIAIQSWTFRTSTFADACAQIASLGITRLELSPRAHGGFPQNDDEIAAHRALLAAHGLECLTSGIEPVSVDDVMNRAVFDYAQKLGLRTIMVDAPPDALDSLEQLVAEYDLRIGLHNHGPGSRYATIADVVTALDGRDARIGAIVDTGHFTRANQDPIEALHTLAGRVYGVHLKDVAGANPAASDMILGEGVLDLAGVIRTLREIQIPADASISVEYEANPAGPYEDVAVCLANLERAIAG